MKQEREGTHVLVGLGDCDAEEAAISVEHFNDREKLDELSSAIPMWFFKAVSQKSGMPVVLSLSSATSVMDAPASSSESAASPAATSASVGSALPETISERRAYSGA